MYDLFFMRFFISSLVSSFLIIVILLSKRIFNKHISIRGHYNIWFLFLIMLSIPFIPSQFFYFGNLYEWVFHGINSNRNTVTNISTLVYDRNIFYHNTDWLQDLTVSVSRSTPVYLNILFIGTWLTGAFVLTVVTTACNDKIRHITKSVQSLENNEIEILFEQCKKELKINKNLILGKSSLIQTPMAVGFIHTYIILPVQIVKQLSIDDIKYILLHELNHYKNKDILINYMMCLFQILYWFNPFVWLAFKAMRTDREIACDISVLKMLDEKCYADYGRTIINFADKLSQSSHLIVAADMAGSKKQIKKRIEKIASFTTESKLLRLKSIGIFTLIGFLIFSQAPAISAMTYDDSRFDFREKHLAYEDLSAYFNGFEGSFVLYDLHADQYSIYNKDKSMERVSPDSTYKIYSSLVALDQNIIQDENAMLYWNGENYQYEAWNKDHNLSSAIKESVNWYFQQLDKSIGQKKLQSYLKQIGYGNYNLSAGISNFWMESSLRISPVEQVLVLKDLYSGKSIFQKESVDIVKNVLTISEKDGAILSGKTGTGNVDHNNINGWFVGYVETEGNVYFFATNIQDSENADGKTATDITLSILNDKHIY